MTGQSTTWLPRTTARRAANSSAMDRAARAGFAARGVLYLLIGVIALRVAFHPGDGEQADRSGALAEIAEKPFGSVLLWALGIATAGMALWRLSEAAFGASGPDGHKTHKRLFSACRAVFYGFVAYSVMAFAAGSGGGGSSDRQSKDITARALEMPGGRWLVGAAAIGVVVAGGWILVRAVRRKFHKHLKTGEMSRRVRQAVDVLGVFGGVARGVLFGAVGVFALVAAVRFDPDEAKGMDDTLRAFTQTSAGPWLLVVIAVGLVAFAGFSFASARYRRT
ncbi:hypothetical protein M2169_003438 [Streptomyces sp. MJP52]|uniref:DUF1206 domain-containing protein n=2 Tax=Streptomyces TaxID=1883 RepID=UPI00247D9C9E|nr:hypothetical protein [Streptomyces sp. MJP52]